MEPGLLRSQRTLVGYAQDLKVELPTKSRINLVYALIFRYNTVFLDLLKFIKVYLSPNFLFVHNFNTLQQSFLSFLWVLTELQQSFLSFLWVLTDFKR
jgi:hypothetical protein